MTTFTWWVLVLIGQYQKRIKLELTSCEGSVIGHEVHNRQRQDYDMRLYQDYFCERPTHPRKFFRRRFQMRWSLFIWIAQVVEEHDDYFIQRRNDVRALGFFCLQKVTVAYNQLTYAVPVDYVDEYMHIGESTSIECLRRYIRAVCEVLRNNISSYQFGLHTTQKGNRISSICITFHKNRAAMATDVSWDNTYVDRSNGAWWRRWC
jgi:hypothetical protein